MTHQEHKTRRKLIQRRWAAYRMSKLQRAIWQERKARKGDELPEVVSVDSLLAELPDSLLE